jgi:hypothetical protein
MENNIISLSEYVTKKEVAEYQQLKDYVRQLIEDAGGFPTSQPYIVKSENDIKKVYDIDGIAHSLMDIQVVLEVMGKRNLSDKIDSVVAELLGIEEE